MANKAQFEQQLKALQQAQAEKYARILAQKKQIPYIDLNRFPIDPQTLKLIGQQPARKANLVAIQAAGKNISLACLDPKQPAARKIVKELESQGFKIKLFLASSQGLRKAWRKYADIAFIAKKEPGLIDLEKNNLAKLEKDLKHPLNIAQIKKHGFAKADSSQQIFYALLIAGIRAGASDLSLEPQKDAVRARVKLDGLFQTLALIDKTTFTSISSQIKLTAGAVLNRQSQAQEGRFSVKALGRAIEIRASLIPSIYGDSASLRILDPAQGLLDLDKIGLGDQNLAILQEQLAKPHGLILNTGPTGSGKTTTLYACLKKLAQPDKKIITLEDPIEYQLPGLEQTQIRPDQDYSFSQGLKAILRQNPDIIMIGEIRDNETAQICLDASLTGHLVFSTLHTNNAPSAIYRLLSLGINREGLASGLNLIIAQRLVRKVCPQCALFKQPTAAELKLLQTELPKKAINWSKVKLPSPKKCRFCHQTGYKGRLGIFELVVVSQTIKNLISGLANEEQIKKALADQGWTNMKQDGLLKAVDGLTTIAEILRIVG